MDFHELVNAAEKNSEEYYLYFFLRSLSFDDFHSPTHYDMLIRIVLNPMILRVETIVNYLTSQPFLYLLERSNHQAQNIIVNLFDIDLTKSNERVSDFFRQITATLVNKLYSDYALRETKIFLELYQHERSQQALMYFLQQQLDTENMNPLVFLLEAISDKHISPFIKELILLIAEHKDRKPIDFLVELITADRLPMDWVVHLIHALEATETMPVHEIHGELFIALCRYHRPPTFNIMCRYLNTYHNLQPLFTMIDKVWQPHEQEETQNEKIAELLIALATTSTLHPEEIVKLLSHIALARDEGELFAEPANKTELGLLNEILPSLAALFPELENAAFNMGLEQKNRFLEWLPLAYQTFFQRDQRERIRPQIVIALKLSAIFDIDFLNKLLETFPLSKQQYFGLLFELQSLSCEPIFEERKISSGRKILTKMMQTAHCSADTPLELTTLLQRIEYFTKSHLEAALAIAQTDAMIETCFTRQEESPTKFELVENNFTWSQIHNLTTPIFYSDQELCKTIRQTLLNIIVKAGCLNIENLEIELQPESPDFPALNHQELYEALLQLARTTSETEMTFLDRVNPILKKMYRKESTQRRANRQALLEALRNRPDTESPCDPQDQTVGSPLSPRPLQRLSPLFFRPEQEKIPEPEAGIGKDFLMQ